MPIIEFKCERGHLTELIILSGTESEKIKATKCYHDDEEDSLPCGLQAKRVEFSLSVPHFSPDGVGGFYKPSATKIAGKEDPTRYVQQAFEELGGREGIVNTPEIMNYKPKKLKTHPKKSLRVVNK